MGAIDELPLLQRHRLTVDEYYRMAEVGVLAPDARVELIDGEIIDKAPQKSRHASVVNELMHRLLRSVGDHALVTCRTPLRLSQRSEPEPDLMLLRPRADGYAQSHPTAAEVLLLIDVADSSARYDREIKLPLYASHGVAEVWIIDLEAGLLRRRRKPGGEDYAEADDDAAPGSTPLPGLPGIGIDMGGLLA